MEIVSGQQLVCYEPVFINALAIGFVMMTLLFAVSLGFIIYHRKWCKSNE